MTMESTVSSQVFLKWMIFLEITLVFLIILITIFLKLYLNIVKSNKDKLIKEIVVYFQDVYLSSVFNFSNFPAKWLSLEILTHAISGLDKQYNDEKWQSIKYKVYDEILLPLARKYYSSSKKVQKILSARCFAEQAHPEDNAIIQFLLKNKIPLVQLNAAVAAVKYGNTYTVNQLIDYLSKRRRINQSIYQSIFKANPSLSLIISERIEKEGDPYVLATCYRVLTLYPKEIVPTISTQFVKHLELNNIELKIAILKYLCNIQDERAVSNLLKGLTDENWEVRSTCCKLLENYKGSEIITLLTQALHDPVWWVRINAALALKKQGPQGIENLKNQTIEQDKFAYETAQYILNLDNHLLL